MSAVRSLVRIAVYGVVFGAATFGAVAVFAWTGPTGSPPNNNIAAPLNISTTNQSKGASTNAPAGTNGYLGANGFCIGGNCVSNWSGVNYSGSAGGSTATVGVTCNSGYVLTAYSVHVWDGYPPTYTQIWYTCTLTY